MDADTKRLAIQRVKTLFYVAGKTAHEDLALAQRYVELARKIAMAAKVRLPKEYRLQVCRRCKSFILPGVNCRVRIRPRREHHIVITCLNCGKQTRNSLGRKKPKEKLKHEQTDPREEAFR